MHKFMAVALLGVAVLVGCENMNKDSDATDDTKKMSIEGKSGDCNKCTETCDKADKPA